MILADKIIENRKKNGWSQEELAEKLGVSRQSVSKWEGAQAIPDMKKIVQMSELFGVSTDFLLKDELEEIEAPAVIPTESSLADEAARKVSMEEANAFLNNNESNATKVSIGVMLCILSPVVMIILSGLSETGKLSMSEDEAGIMGLILLLILAAIGVALFLITGFRSSRFEYLEQENIETEYGITGMVRERKAAYAPTHTRYMIIGIMMCVIAVIPMLMLAYFGYRQNSDDSFSIIGVGIMLVIIAIGVKLIVKTSILDGGLDKLLEEGDYTRLNKKASRYDGIYWTIALVIYLGWSFITFKWEFTWIVWPIAGVLYAAFHEIMKAMVKSKNPNL